MPHSFEEQDAIQYGILEAILLYNIRYWIAKNIANEKHFHDGKYWTYNSAKAYAKLFPYASQQTIQRALKKLEEMGAIVIGCYNTNPYDHTKWYSITDSSNLINQKIKSDQPSNTYINTNNTVTNEDSSFDKFWNAYPRKTNKGFARKVFNKLKPSEELLNKMLAALEQHKAGWTDPKYIPHPSTWLNGERWEDEVEQQLSAYQKMMRS